MRAAAGSERALGLLGAGHPGAQLDQSAHWPCCHCELADAVSLVELYEVNATERRVSDRGFEDESEEWRLASRGLREQVSVPECVARRFHGAKRRGDRILANDRVVGGWIQHDDIESQLLGSGLDVAGTGSGKESLGRVHNANYDRRIAAGR